MASKYISALTGPQMDQSLLDMANHDSEAWGVGTRGGTAVVSGDPAYHNNAKYYAGTAHDDAQTATGAAARAEAAVPAGTEGAVMFSVSQTLSDAQKEQAKANIGAGGTNPNLLDNPWFTVNQRGVSGAVTTSNYYLDRWRCTFASGVNTIVATGAVTFDTGTNGDLVQPIETLPLGKAVTISALLSDGTIEIVMGNMPATTPASTGFVIIGDGTNVRLRIRWSGSIWQLYVTPIVKPVTVNAVKLEIGSVSTLANDTPPNYAEELAKCQYYFERVNNSSSVNKSLGYAVATETTNMYMPFKVAPKRISPSITITGSLKYGQTSYSSTATGATWYEFDKNTGYGSLKISASGLTQWTTYRIATAASTYIDFSADL